MAGQYASILLLLALALSSGDASALEAGTRDGPGASEGIASLELEILQVLLPEQVEAYRNGAPLSEITLTTGETLEEFLATPAQEPGYELTWTTLSSGGGASEGGAGGCGVFELYGISGQPVTGESTDGSYEMTAGSLTRSDLIFADGFESGTTSCWSLEQSN